MKRSAPLNRTSSLRRGVRLIRRTAIRTLGTRKMRRREALRVFRAEVMERAGWTCERCNQRMARHAHHIWPVGRGGPDESWNGAALCLTCHDRVTCGPLDEWLASNAAEARRIRENLDRALIEAPCGPSRFRTLG